MLEGLQPIIVFLLLVLHLIKRTMEETQSQPEVNVQPGPVAGAQPQSGYSAQPQSGEGAQSQPGAGAQAQSGTGTPPKELKKPEKAWYAVYTNSRAEKRVSDRIGELDIETFLPLQKTLRQWSDRKKLVEKPLISSYVFVKIIPRDYFTVRKIDGVVKFIMLQGKPVPIPEVQITNLRILCGSDAEVEISADVYEKGDQVEVTVGSLAGLRGELIRVGRKHKVVIRIIQPGMNLTVDIKTNAIRKLGKITDI